MGGVFVLLGQPFYMSTGNRVWTMQLRNGCCVSGTNVGQDRDLDTLTSSYGPCTKRMNGAQISLPIHQKWYCGGR